jgi:hypothetical protein
MYAVSTLTVICRSEAVTVTMEPKTNRSAFSTTFIHALC